MRLSIKILSLATIIAAAVAAKADTLDFTLIGGGNTYTFTLPSNPSPNSSVMGTSFTLSNIMVTEDAGTPMGIVFSSDLTFSEIAHGGGLEFPLPSSPLPTPINLDLTGPQLYMGSENSPMFSPTSMPFTLKDATDSDTFTLDIATTQSPVPEPSSIALLTTGLLALAGTGRRKLLTR